MGRTNMNHNKKGFSLIELMMAVSIFVIIILAVTGIFSSSMGGFHKAKIVQKNLEDAEFIMNKLIKVLRTSSIDLSSATSSSEIKIYDYSMDMCYKYRFENNKIEVSFTQEDSVPLNTFDPLGWCFNSSGVYDYGANPEPDFSPYASMAASYVRGSFFTVPSNKTLGAEKLGKVTVSMELCRDPGCLLEDRIRIQSSVSLRDYYNSGI
jgi:prepilin-type N-terminal cleavage/methylation domain-containing protein